MFVTCTWKQDKKKGLKQMRKEGRPDHLGVGLAVKIVVLGMLFVISLYRNTV